MSSYLFHPYTRFSTIENEKFPNIVKGSGVYLFDDNGKRYMDIISSWWACALGHNHPKIVQSIQDPDKYSSTFDYRQHDSSECPRAI